MRRFLPFLLALPLLLSGCAGVIRSEVTAFHQWPSTGLAADSFAFEPVASLEQQSYENLLRAQLQQLGLRQAPAGEAALRVGFTAASRARDVRVVETVLVDSWCGMPWYGPGFFSPYRAWPGYGYPFYGPTWPSAPVAQRQERRMVLYDRELKVKIAEAAGGKPLYEVTVKSEGKEGNLARVMPYLVQSAFAGFPGKSGEPRVVELKMKD